MRALLSQQQLTRNLPCGNHLHEKQIQVLIRTPRGSASRGIPPGYTNHFLAVIEVGIAAHLAHPRGNFFERQVWELGALPTFPQGGPLGVSVLSP